MVQARIKSHTQVANLASYDRAYASFDWADGDAYFSYAATGKLNLAFEAMDRWAEDPYRADDPALIATDGESSRTVSFAELSAMSKLRAGALREAGLGMGMLLAVISDDATEIFSSLLACARLGAVFTCLPPDASEAWLLETCPLLAPDMYLWESDSHRGAARAMAFGAPIIWPEETGDMQPGEFSLAELTARAAPMEEPLWLEAEAPFYTALVTGGSHALRRLHYAHGAMAGIYYSGHWGLDLRYDSTLWCDSAPWSLQTIFYGALAAWLNGATAVVRENRFEPNTWLNILQEHKVSVWYTSQDIIRRLREAEDDLPDSPSLDDIEHVACLSNFPDYELFFWLRNRLGPSMHDVWAAPETGMLILANFPCLDLKLGSMGKPMPGVTASLRGESNNRPGLFTVGELCLKPDWPGLPLEISPVYHPEKFTADGWLRTGVKAVTDEEGYYYPQGRVDAIVRRRDTLFGAWEMEKAIKSHPAVDDAGAIVVADASGRSHFKVFFVAKPGEDGSSLEDQVLAHALGYLLPRAPLIAAIALDELPRNDRGELVRRALMAYDLGLPWGDVSGLAPE